MAAMKKGARSTGRRGRSRSGGTTVGELGRPSLALVLLVAGLLLASAFVAIEIQRNALARQSADLLRDIAAAEATHGQLAADVASKQTDDYAMNKARDYGYVLPSEAIIGVQQAPTVPVAVAKAPEPSHAQKWIALFFGAR